MEPITVKILPDDPGPAAIRILLAFGISTITAIALVYIQRKMSAPDFFLTAKMRGCNLAANYADSRASFWHGVSERATKIYLDSRP